MTGKWGFRGQVARLEHLSINTTTSSMLVLSTVFENPQRHLLSLSLVHLGVLSV